MLKSCLKSVLVNTLVLVSLPFVVVGALALALAAGPRPLPVQILPVLDFVLPQPSSNCSIAEAWSACAARIDDASPLDAEKWMAHLQPAAMTSLGHFGITTGHWLPQLASEYLEIIDMQFRAAGYGNQQIHDGAHILAFLWAATFLVILSKSAKLLVFLMRGVFRICWYCTGRWYQRKCVGGEAKLHSDTLRLRRMDSPAKVRPPVVTEASKTAGKRHLQAFLHESRSSGKGRLNSPRVPLKEVPSCRNSRAQQDISAK